MADRYTVRGGVGPALPGTVSPGEVDGRTEWVPVGGGPEGLLGALAPRLGSGVDAHRLVLGVLAPLAHALDGPPLAALLAHLPPAIAGELAAGGATFGGRVRRPSGAGDYLLEVARLVQQPPWRAATAVRAVFAAARAVLAGEDLEAIAARLPPDLADLVRTAS